MVERGVGRGDKQYVRQVVVHVDIVVVEMTVLLGVEYFEQRGSRVALVVVADFVEFVEHEHGVHRTGAFHRVDDAAWHGTDICAAVTAYFGLVVESAERHSLVFTPQGMCDRFANRGLAHAGRANEAYNRRLAARVVHNQGKLLEYALFDLVEAVVVVFEYFACFFEVSYRCCLLMPRQLDQRVEIGVEHRVVRATRG